MWMHRTKNLSRTIVCHRNGMILSRCSLESISKPSFEKTINFFFIESILIKCKNTHTLKKKDLIFSLLCVSFFDGSFIDYSESKIVFRRQ